MAQEDVGEAAGLRMQLVALGGQMDLDQALIHRAAPAAEEASRLEALDRRDDRAGLECEALADRTDRQAFPLINAPKPDQLTADAPTLPLDGQLCFSIYSASLAIQRVYKPMLDALSRASLACHLS
ncbi:hypothetical protein ASE66_24175 [Bosea sp. Root483D1]|nr:hypothetical protein ASE66_24175 [Bosea sp. Root483D1]